MTMFFNSNFEILNLNGGKLATTHNYKSSQYFEPTNVSSSSIGLDP